VTYDAFINFVEKQCRHETIYTDSSGQQILIIRMFDAYQMVSKLNPLINQPINYVLNLNTRAKNCLLAEEIVTVADLFKRLEREKYFLEKVPNMGKATTKLILDELARVFPLMKLQNGGNDERTA
jgi:DNA-directed RNA polymerase alpha subunit